MHTHRVRVVMMEEHGEMTVITRTHMLGTVAHVHMMQLRPRQRVPHAQRAIGRDSQQSHGTCLRVPVWHNGRTDHAVHESMRLVRR